MARISAFSLLQSFNTDTWVTGMAFGLYQIGATYLLVQVNEETDRNWQIYV